MERNRGAIAKKLDNNAVLEEARKAFAIANPAEDAERLRNIYNHMLFTVNHGEIAVVNTEGTGCIADEDGNIGLYFSYDFLITRVDLKVEDLGGAVTETEIDLADGIRTFGSRLDANHSTWFNKYDGK